jgi:tRNA 2-selenouridine synthase
VLLKKLVSKFIDYFVYMQTEGLPIEDFIKQSKVGVIIDVRSPIEYFKGHIPCAINVPLFEDTERAEIGTMYKQQGKETAVTRGLEIVSPKMVQFVTQVKSLAQGRKIFVYCFRGGMRSNSFAWLMNTSGLEARILTGGYKAYRNYVLNYFSKKFKLVLLGGSTGSGKTNVLKYLSNFGIQSIDLEAIAHHKGSAFGSINEVRQNPQQVFEHQLFDAFQNLNDAQLIVLEDESQTIGYNKIPHPLWLQMKQATIIKLDIPFELRVQKLVEDYSTTDIMSLKECVHKISEKLGGDNAKLCLQYLDEGNLEDVARRALQYYDKAYSYLYNHKKQSIVCVESDTIDGEINARKVKKIIDSLN